jgi:hypothetical protein
MEFSGDGITDPNYKSVNYINPKNSPRFKSLLKPNQSSYINNSKQTASDSLQEIEFDYHFDRDFVPLSEQNWSQPEDFSTPIELHDYDDLIYDGSNITVRDFSIAFLALVHKNKIIENSANCILKFIRFEVPFYFLRVLKI